ncbi:putative PC-Esterase [Helianthus anomalus]
MGLKDIEKIGWNWVKLARVIKRTRFHCGGGGVQKGHHACSGIITRPPRVTLESSLNKLKAKGVNVQLINITQLTQHRKDAHPTVYRRLWRPLTEEQKNNPQRTSDCTHWCLPGVPDIWNEILLAYIFPTIKTAS